MSVDSEGKLKVSNGVPYCTVCSWLALYTGISFFIPKTESNSLIRKAIIISRTLSMRKSVRMQEK